MKLPNADHAIVDIKKLIDYCLNPKHPRGKHKVRSFESALGLKVKDAENLQTTLLNIIRTHDAVATEEDQYGKRYVIDFMLSIAERQAKEDFPRLTSCYVLKRGG